MSKDPWQERAKLYQQRWDSLVPAAQLPNQLAGRTAVGCGATHHVMERCDFSCTCCYLGPEANKVEPLPFEEVKKQLDEIRANLGPRGKTQITAGEVTLLPVDELGRIVAYARSIGLDPMVMTHGQRFIEQPDYLKTLVSKYGLQKISVHIDTTQRGRPNTRKINHETDLNPVRDGFAKLIRNVRKETGARLSAASTITVTEANVDQLPETIQWFYRNADAFRLLSFQPVANVGRTRKKHSSAEVRDALWDQVNLASGNELNETPLHFGHPECNRTVPLLIVRCGNATHSFESARKNNQYDKDLLEQSIQVFGNRIRWAESASLNFLRGFGLLLRRPKFLLSLIPYVFYRAFSETPTLLRIAADSIRFRTLPRANIFLYVVHRFMDGEELSTPLGKERLDSCVFKVPVDGEFISMCELNATELRQKIDARLKG